MPCETLMLDAPPIAWVRAHAFRFPTDAPEADGTIAWDATTMVIVHVEAGPVRGMGYSYADGAAASVINNVLAPVIAGRDACAIPMLWSEMVGAVRNIGWRGIA